MGGSSWNMSTMDNSGWTPAGSCSPSKGRATAERCHSPTGPHSSWNGMAVDRSPAGAGSGRNRPTTDHAGKLVGASPSQKGTTSGQQPRPAGPSLTSDRAAADSPAGSGSSSSNWIAAEEPDGLLTQTGRSGRSVANWFTDCLEHGYHGCCA